MRTTHILIYGGLLVAALIASYLTWTHDPPGGKGDVVVIDAKAESLQQVVYDETDLHVAVQRRVLDGDAFCWGETRKTRDAPKRRDHVPPALAAGDDDDSAAAEAPPERITTEKAFRGNETCDKVLGRFAPMRALRVFEKISAEKTAEMGLDESEATLSVTTDKGERVFDVGARCYGSNNYYLQEHGSGHVLLVESRMIGDIKGGSTRLMENSLQTYGKDEVERAVVTAGPATREFLHQNRDDSKLAFWADAAEPNRTHDAADAWLDRVFRLRALEYFAEPPQRLALVVRVQFLDAGRELGFMEIATAVDEEGQPLHLIRTENTIEWVKVSDRMGEETVGQIEAVVGE